VRLVRRGGFASPRPGRVIAWSVGKRLPCWAAGTLRTRRRGGGHELRWPCVAGRCSDDIARAAGISRQTVYAHFPSREALLDAVIEHAAAEVTEALDAAGLDEAPPAVALIRLLDAGWQVTGPVPVPVATPRRQPGSGCRPARPGSRPADRDHPARPGKRRLRRRPATRLAADRRPGHRPCRRGRGQGRADDDRGRHPRGPSQLPTPVRAAYRCRHGYTSAARPDPERPKNLYVRADQILPRLATLAILLARQDQAPGLWGHAARQVTPPAAAAELIDHLRTSGRTLTYDPQQRTLRADTQDPIAVTIG
jgi:AcrR family transcriptional regulator